MSDTSSGSRVSLGFLTSFGIFLVLSTLLFGVGYRAPRAVLLSPLAPVIFGLYELGFGHVDGTPLFSLGLSVAAFATVGLAIRYHQRVGLRIVAHCCLAMYWFWSFCVVGLWVH